MFRVLLIAVCLLCAFVALQSAPLAFLVFDSHTVEAGRLPDGWHIRSNRGTPEVKVISDGEEKVLELRSNSSSFALERGVDIDPSQFPFLTWKWKVAQLPRGGDFRHYSTDDQAAQVLVAFGDRKVLTYIWDSTAPKDTAQSASGIPLVHIFAFVCRSGASDLNRWVPEVRNIAGDYERAFGRRPKDHVKGVRIQINSQHTGTSAVSYFGDVAFRAAPAS